MLTQVKLIGVPRTLSAHIYLSSDESNSISHNWRISRRGHFFERIWKGWPHCRSVG